MKTWIFFLLILLFGFISCDKDNDLPVDNTCSVNNTDGECKDDKLCINGRCVYQCGDNLNCPEDYFHCEANICYDTTAPCSVSNHFGKCSDSDATCVEGICKNLNPCNREHPTGICSSENRFCYDGICVEVTKECKPWNINGSCPKDYYCSSEGTCFHKKVDPPCSLQYQDGKCYLESNICINGLCMDAADSCNEVFTSCPSGQDCDGVECIISPRNPCNDSNLFGYCEDKDEACYNGVCYSLTEDCSPENPLGLCPKDTICNSEKCVPWLIECDSSNNIYCPDMDRQICENNKCVDKAIFCEDGLVDGLCPENEACVNSECRAITAECSPSNLNGLCNALNLKCILGECLDNSQENICSSLSINGKCPPNQVCNNGTCEGDVTALDIGNSCIMDTECKESLYCEKTFLDGYCTKDCSQLSDCSDGSICYKVSQDKGYCLAKCSVNIPNSCDRLDTENYICYPESGNDGSCMYDCKYHNCFETGKTCNQLTGICE